MSTFNMNKFVNGSPEATDHLIEKVQGEVVNPSDDSKKRGRKKKETSVATVATGTIPEATTSMSYIQNNIPYANSYQETTEQLNESISQLNMLGNELMGELQNVRASRTLKNKYEYINDMTASATSIISAKISAIKEKNKVMNDIHHLELARMKELKSIANAEDDNTRIANMYDAFVNTPIGTGMTHSALLGPGVQDMMMPGSNLPVMSIGNSEDTAAWEQAQDPAMKRMILEAKGAIDTVVMYDEATGNRWFEVIDKATGQPMMGVEKPDNSNIYDLDINIHGGYAKDNHLHRTYPLIVISGGDSSIMNY